MFKVDGKELGKQPIEKGEAFTSLLPNKVFLASRVLGSTKEWKEVAEKSEYSVKWTKPEVSVGTLGEFANAFDNGDEYFAEWYK